MSLISPDFDVTCKSIIFPNFGQGPFPQIAGKSPDKQFMDTPPWYVAMALSRKQRLFLRSVQPC